MITILNKSENRLGLPYYAEAHGMLKRGSFKNVRFKITAFYSFTTQSIK